MRIMYVIVSLIILLVVLVVMLSVSGKILPTFSEFVNTVTGFLE